MNYLLNSLIKVHRTLLEPTRSISITSSLSYLIEFMLTGLESSTPSRDYIDAWNYAADALDRDVPSAFLAFRRLVLLVEICRIRFVPEARIIGLLRAFASISEKNRGTGDFSTAILVIGYAAISVAENIGLDLHVVLDKLTSDLEGIALGMEPETEYSHLNPDLLREAIVCRGRTAFSHATGAQGYREGLGGITDPESSGDDSSDSDGGLPPRRLVSSTKMVFVRHGDSLWNEAERKRTGQINGYGLGTFEDALLSAEGIAQAKVLRDIVALQPTEVFDWEDRGMIDLTARQEALALMLGEDAEKASKTFIASSNLKRALLTGLIALHYRLEDGPAKPQLNLLSSAQEMSIAMAADARSVTPAGRVPEFTPAHSKYVDKFDINPSRNKRDQNTAVSAVTGKDRLASFCRLIANIHKNAHSEYVILAGHSLWLRNLFNRFLSKKGHKSSLDKSLTSSKSKLGNTSVVTLRIDVYESPGLMGQKPTLGCVIPRNVAKLAYGYIYRSH